MTCRELAELLIDYVADELAAEQRVALQGHLDACPECVHYVTTYRVTIEITRRLPCVPLSEQLLERLKKALENDN